ncbi:hypothetical protein [Persicitalea sp.]|uniref:hypothetical protein n=1 Tax=Persicitalea sp. TaxID=3100273 RepID=UPI0035934D1C
MTDRWFLQDIDTQLSRRNRMVILDPGQQCDFLLSTLEKQGYVILKTNPELREEWQTVQEELFLRYEAERNHAGQGVVFYVSRAPEQLSFLFDYCYTHGLLDLTRPAEWIRKKIFVHTGLQVAMENPLLLTATKLGIGKDLGWWKKIVQDLEEMVSLDEELLPFLHNPDFYFKRMDADVRRLFEEKLAELTGKPYLKKSPKIWAKEVAALFFEGLLTNTISDPLLALYRKWVDSNKYAEALTQYLSDYKVPRTLDVWAAHPEHGFEELDRRALRELCENIWDKSYIQEKLGFVRERLARRKTNNRIPAWWQDVVTLLDFESNALAGCHSLDKVVGYYTTEFQKVDRAIRRLYTHFLADKGIMKPLQEYYESLNGELLQQWFECHSDYASNQPGYLVDLLKTAPARTAIIVGDGLRYEMAAYVATRLEKQFVVERSTMLADMPSETEHNMSALYVGKDQVLPIHKDREKKLGELTGKPLTFMQLEALHYGVEGHYLVLTYKDINKAGETLQQGAIKLFDEFEKLLVDKISLLLKMGYQAVHVVTDHGFVLTGILEESDKIDPLVTGKKEVHERFIRTVEKQTNPGWVSFERPYGEYRYAYVAPSCRPFKSKGMYGYAHGGFSPQEIIILNFVFRNHQAAV